ncbi:MAG: 16S rRNA (guanine(966)-N(2))-methyltransferase RsmD [Planctomycetota bacterium]|nr:MAG: 16S rRNA (guanine(966)-N(2))-methyltransferase RsmD [Planctomycetota bacterium]
MRIIAGTKRGMKLLSPKGFDTRPITDMVKESLFNVLYNYGLPQDRVAADLFCGVGSLGLEALSRGAKKVTFVDDNPNVIETLHRNLAKAGFTGRSKVIKANVLKIGADAGSSPDKYELVFVDPPYKMTEEVGADSPLAGILELVSRQAADEAIVVVRTHRRTKLLDTYSRLKVIDRRRWGTMAVVLLRLDG